MANNKKLTNAKVAKQDEFYTQLVDIENELKHYKEHFEGKIVFCNCDDPFESNFFKYFAINFNHLKLKKLICTCYAGSPVSQTEFDDLPLFASLKENEKLPYLIQITEVPDLNGDGATDLSDIELLLKSDKNILTALDGDGDFRSEESIGFLKEADIVVTNPPFSLFSEYVAQLIEYNKKFIIIGSMNALHYRDIFPLVRDNKMWTGYSFNKTLRFQMPDYYESKDVVNGKKYGKVPAICWFTNLPIPKRNEELILYKKYNKNDYPKFDNFDAINVNRVNDIPDGYDGIMGVPDSFMNFYNPDQFEIIGRSGDTDWVFNSCSFFTPPSKDNIEKYKKMNKTWRLQNVYLLDESGIPIIVYSRIFIRRKQ